MKRKMVVWVYGFLLMTLLVVGATVTNILTTRLQEKDYNKLVSYTGTDSYNIEKDILYIYPEGRNINKIVFDFNGNKIYCPIIGDLTEEKLKEGTKKCVLDYIESRDREAQKIKNAHKLEGKKGKIEKLK